MNCLSEYSGLSGDRPGKRFGFILILFLLFALNIHAQDIPDFQTNATHRDSVDFKKLLKSTSQYDLIISLRQSSYWMGATDYYVLAKKGKRWHQFYLNTLIKDSTGNADTGKVEIYKRKTKMKPDDIVWNELQKSNILTMNPRALDSFVEISYFDTTICNYYTMERLTISDGISWSFIIKTRTRMRVLSSYQPESYYKEYPGIIEYKYFSDCLDIFHRLWEKK